MDTTESCAMCEHSVITFEAKDELSGLYELPNTFDARRQEYRWQREELMSYAMIPRSVDGTKGTVDLYLCIDEDVLDDIDVFGYAKKFIRDQLLPSWSKFVSAQLTQPCLSPPTDVRCWKFHHAISGAGQ